MNSGECKLLAAFPIPAVVILLSLIIGGCAATGSVLRKDESKFETTGLFTKPCGEKTCNEVDIVKMITAFDSIKETDEEKGILGDLIDEVKTKGFTIFLDDDEKIRRPGTEILYGADALSAVGIPLNLPQLNTPEAVETYKKYMKAHFAWTFKEMNLKGMADRFFINTKNTSVSGPAYSFVITFKDGRVFRRVIKGGPQNTITQEKAFLLGPGGFLENMFGSKVGGSIIK